MHARLPASSVRWIGKGSQLDRCLTLRCFEDDVLSTGARLWGKAGIRDCGVCSTGGSGSLQL
jgi:hypothetical protein